MANTATRITICLETLFTEAHGSSCQESNRLCPKTHLPIWCSTFSLCIQGARANCGLPECHVGETKYDLQNGGLLKKCHVAPVAPVAIKIYHSVMTVIESQGDAHPYQQPLNLATQTARLQTFERSGGLTRILRHFTSAPATRKSNAVVQPGNSEVWIKKHQVIIKHHPKVRHFSINWIGRN